MATTTRNVATRLLATPRNTAGVYFADLTYTTRANESALNANLQARIQTFARQTGGVLVSSTITRPTPGLAVFALSFRFQNRGQVLTFVQNIGNSHEANAVVCVPDAAALVALP
jgi:hypothetical protein